MSLFVALRIEWCKAYARVRRWKEEVMLVEEEARRAPVFLEHRAKEWERRVKEVRVGEIPEDQAEGAIAYGLKQAVMYRDIAAQIGVSMTEVRRGRGKRRMKAVEEADYDEEDEIGVNADEDELEDLRGGASDDDFVLRGGEDDD
ncbi:hypothetical protein B0H16DRAFT_1330222 [Mycena metata]|uniref:Uncharacterized protein n=1 Tax=Mycena metata TaxID=1033252 RepID=A0AAD7MS89_9AGAR|nr:hypothetical protein B0H16DRAFT_1330222 [Mycena metata]